MLPSPHEIGEFKLSGSPLPISITTARMRIDHCLIRTTRTAMFHIFQFEGLGWLAIIGLPLIMLTEVVVRAVTHDPTITAPRSWWLISGYAVAAVYCVALHCLLRLHDAKKRVLSPGRKHSLMHIPVRYWSIFYLVIGLARVYSPK